VCVSCTSLPLRVLCCTLCATLLLRFILSLVCATFAASPLFRMADTPAIIRFNELTARFASLHGTTTTSNGTGLPSTVVMTPESSDFPVETRSEETAGPNMSTAGRTPLSYSKSGRQSSAIVTMSHSSPVVNVTTVRQPSVLCPLRRQTDSVVGGGAEHKPSLDVTGVKKPSSSSEEAGTRPTSSFGGPKLLSSSTNAALADIAANSNRRFVLTNYFICLPFVI